MPADDCVADRAGRMGLRAPNEGSSADVASFPLGRLERGAHGNGFTVFQTISPSRIDVKGHAHEGASLCFLLSGSFEERGRRGLRATRGELVLSAPYEEVDLLFGPEPVRALLIDLEPELLEELDAGGGSLSNHTRKVHGPFIEGLARRVYLELAESESALLEEAVLALCDGLRSRSALSARGISDTTLARALSALHEGYRAPIGLTVVAKQVGVHRVSLARGFRRATGLSVGEYLHRLRTSYAMARLADRTSGCSIAEIARDAGFSDQSHLTRVFRRMSGRTPNAFRKRVSFVQDRDNERAIPSRDEDNSHSRHS